MNDITIRDQIVRFGRIIFESIPRSTHLAVGVGSSTLQFRNKVPVTIKFTHVYVKFILSGANFDKYSYMNTKSNSDQVEVTDTWSDEISREDASLAELGIDLAKCGVSGKGSVSEKTASKESEGGAQKRVLPDLRITLNNHSINTPEWKIFQINNSDLVLDPRESTRMADIESTELQGLVSLSGKIWTDRDGYKIEVSKQKILERCNPSMGFHMALLKQKLRRHAQSYAPLRVSQI